VPALALNFVVLYHHLVSECSKWVFHRLFQVLRGSPVDWVVVLASQRHLHHSWHTPHHMARGYQDHRHQECLLVHHRLDLLQLMVDLHHQDILYQVQTHTVWYNVELLTSVTWFHAQCYLLLAGTTVFCRKFCHVFLCFNILFFWVWTYHNPVCLCLLCLFHVVSCQLLTNKRIIIIYLFHVVGLVAGRQVWHLGCKRSSATITRSLILGDFLTWNNCRKMNWWNKNGIWVHFYNFFLWACLKCC